MQEKKKVGVPENKSNPTTLHSLKTENFTIEIDGKQTGLYTLKNDNGVEITFTDYGQHLVALYLPDKNGNFEDVVLGFDTIDAYINGGGAYMGSVIGRYGNRIAEGKFTLDGTEYTLAQNNNGNHLHGGIKGFHAVVWDANQLSNSEIEFERTSPDMEEGYPGNLKVKVTYTLSDENELNIKYTATTDKTTVLNLTHHSFFNLEGEGNGTVDNHEMRINADAFTPVDAGLIPTGEIKKVAGTPFDFRQMKSIARDIESGDEQLLFAKGYDHNFVLNQGPTDENGLVLAAEVVAPKSGRTLQVYTNEPAIQFYGGNFLNGKDIGKSGKPYPFRGAFCLETQHYPDSPNQPGFPSTVLEPGEVYSSVCMYKFGLIE
ncbi:aldose epimerase family protein [Aggregatimonas sangjinii]|nr:aldose epimerase family protein [Aggregatimonas sangjinii]